MLDRLIANTDNYIGMVILFVLTIAISIPLIRVARSEERLTWTKAVLLGTWLTTIGLLLIADIPSRMLYWFDANHTGLAERTGIDFLASKDYIIVRDIVVNTVQGIFFVIIVALVYMWGERHRKLGRFK